MKFFTLFLACSMLFTAQLSAQLFDDEIKIPDGYTPEEVLMPPSPLQLQVLFVGGVDKVQTTATYGYEAGEVYAKEWHDFIGWTPDTEGEVTGWVSVNHELRYRDDRIGDGGGMTAFAVRYNEEGTFDVVEQTLNDGREGQFFNVDFVNTVGETGMNCAGIVGPDGRIWTAEEWFVDDMDEYTAGAGIGGAYPRFIGTTSKNQGIRNTDSVTVDTDIDSWDGVKLAAYENINWMVEIDPRQAVALRKQYNWGRQAFEGGAISTDKRYVYLGEDATPGWFTRFTANTPDDYTSGKLEIYKQDNPLGERWIEIDNTDPEKMLNFKDAATSVGATMFNRIEWVNIDRASGKVYFTETGRDRPGSRWSGELNDGGVFAQHHFDRATAQGTTPESGEYWDYYGRILVYDPATEEVSVHLEGGPYFENSPDEASYPDKHLSNPDGLNVMTIDGQSFLVIQEDLNGTSFGRVPANISNRTCELWLLDLSIENPTVDDLVRLSAVPAGAEVTGAIPVSDGERVSLLFNSQHPSTANPFPFNHSLTAAIHGFENLTITAVNDPDFPEDEEFSIFPNPTSRVVMFNKPTNVALYNSQGQRIKVRRNVTQVNVADLTAGVYYIQNADGRIKKLIVQ